jgi:EpsI family protein
MNEVVKVAKPPGPSALRSLLPWGLLAGALVAAFAQNFAEMWIRWFPAWRHAGQGLYDRITGGESYYTHGPLIPFVSLMIAVLIVRHLRIRVRPRPVVGGIVLVLALLLHLMACLARVNFVSGFAFIATLMGLILMIWGADALRRLWFPMALLLFMVPLPEVTIASASFHLKMLAAKWGVWLASQIGIAVEQVGNRVLLEGDKTLVIANVCNGLRTLISLVAFGALYTYVCRLQGLWRLGLFVASFAVAIISNALRIASLIIVADIWTVKIATGWYHDTSGILVFLVAALFMFGIERFVLWGRRAVGRPATVVPLFSDLRRGREDDQQAAQLAQAMSGRRGWVAVILVLASAAGAVWLNRSIPPFWNEQRARAALPTSLEVAGKLMRSYDLPLDQQTKDILETGDCLNRVYLAPGSPEIALCIIFSRDNRKGTHPPDLCLSGSGDGIIAKTDVTVNDVAGRPGVPCKELLVQNGYKQQYYLYTYKCGGQYTNSFWGQQLAIFGNGLLNRDSSGALIRVSTNVVTTVEEARSRSMQLMATAIPHLDRKLR